MKKKAVCMLLGVLLTGTLLTGCGKNKATEAASESAQTEKEGTGERTADSAEDDQKKTDETADTKTDKKAEKGTDAEETGEDASETEENREKIAVLLPDEQNWTRDAKELEVILASDDVAFGGGKKYTKKKVKVTDGKAVLDLSAYSAVYFGI